MEPDATSAKDFVPSILVFSKSLKMLPQKVTEQYPATSWLVLVRSKTRQMGLLGSLDHLFAKRFTNQHSGANGWKKGLIPYFLRLSIKTYRATDIVQSQPFCFRTWRCEYICFWARSSSVRSAVWPMNARKKIASPSLPRRSKECYEC